MKVIDILKAISKSDLEKLNDLVVRELDEEVGGVFVSYVDEGDLTYDVRIHIKDGVLLENSCDCDAKEDYCLHKLIVLKSLKGVSKTMSKRTRKLSEAEELLIGLDRNTITTWMKSLFKVNKDIELQFLLEFAKQEVFYTAADVSILIDEAIKTVAGRRKKLDAREVKKIADLVNKSLEGVRDFVLIHSHQGIVIDLMNAVYTSIIDFENRVAHTSVRMYRIKDTFIEHTALSIVQIKDSEAMREMLENIWNIVFKEKNAHRGVIGEFELVQQLFNNCSKKQQSFFSSKVIEELERVDISFNSYSIEIKSFFLDILNSAGLMQEYKNYFQPIRYQNDYNIRLLNVLKEVDSDLLEEYCLLIIENNQEENYNIPYYQFLHDLYVREGDIERLVIYKKLLFLTNRSREDYIFILNHDDGALFERFRKFLYLRLESEFHKKKGSEVLVFSLLDAEKNYAEMLSYIDYHMRFAIFFPYMNLLYNFDKEQLLRRLFHIGRYRLFGEEIHKETVEFVVANYPKDLLILNLNKVGFGAKSFNEAVLEALKGE